MMVNHGAEAYRSRVAVVATTRRCRGSRATVPSGHCLSLTHLTVWYPSHLLCYRLIKRLFFPSSIYWHFTHWADEVHGESYNGSLLNNLRYHISIDALSQWTLCAWQSFLRFLWLDLVDWQPWNKQTSSWKLPDSDQRYSTSSDIWIKNKKILPFSRTWHPKLPPSAPNKRIKRKKST